MKHSLLLTIKLLALMMLGACDCYRATTSSRHCPQTPLDRLDPKALILIRHHPLVPSYATVLAQQQQLGHPLCIHALLVQPAAGARGQGDPHYEDNIYLRACHLEYDEHPQRLFSNISRPPPRTNSLVGGAARRHGWWPRRVTSEFCFANRVVDVLLPAAALSRFLVARNVYSTPLISRNIDSTIQYVD